ncbi:uncharacterized protein LOC128243460 [Mya arenaria]|uniref:uncharacterized protein LOC128243460 n=1 Tax=Mya arenaria TaxID=6604 RepID=UPI0022E92EBC|nr:uncharacterized protein LOC128243460 [Mya arenaria]
METEKNTDVSNYLKALKEANSDNEKFAALLMVAKITKSDKCDIEVKRQILDAVGSKFISRLLKTKNVPADCPANIYKSVALSVLSALCTDQQVAESLVLRENVACFNNIVVTNPSEGDVDGEQLIDDTYDCFNSLSQSLTGLETMLAAGTVAAFCDVVVTQTFGYEKAHDLICCMVSCFGPDTWDGIEWSYHKYVNFLGKQFVEDESIHKFEMCKTLVFLLSAAPNDKEETVEPPWIRPIVHGLDNIMRSKIGSEQREPALKLASMMVQVCGIYSLQPPYTPDFKLFLLTTHLSCVEVRMVLEDTDLTQANTKGRLLSSCYTYLENVINHLSSGPPLDLEERQVVQLHSAMVGAFGAVIHFLKRVALTPELQWNSILLATVRVLGAWMAEETAALREEIYDLIPFLVQLSKMCIPPSNKPDCKDASTETVKSDLKLDSNENIADATSSSNTEQPVKQDKSESDTVKNGERQSNGSETEGKVVEMDCDSGPDSEKKSERDQNLEDITKPSIDVEMKSNGNTLDINTVIDTHTEVEGEPDKTGPETKSQGVSTDAENEDGYTDAMQERVRDANLEKDILTEEELQELHVKADILHYLLPGLCHLTAEEEPRKLLLESGALGVLDLYMWRAWERLITHGARGRETLSCLVILCNIFLNLIIVEPAVVPENKEFSHILLLVVKGIHLIEHEDKLLVLWSHLITLGLMLMRALNKTAGDFLEPESIKKFYQSSVRFLSGAYTARHKKKGAVLDIVEPYKVVWEQISQTWFLSMQAFAACIPLYGELPGLILASSWLPSMIKVISDVKPNTVAEETKSCFQLLLTTLARENKTARAVIKDKGGDALNRFFKSREFNNTLNAS